MMPILTLLAPFRMALALSGLLGALAGAATVALLAATSALLAEAGQNLDSLATFAVLCLIAFGGNALTDIVANTAGQKLVATLRRSLAERILAAPVDRLEHYRTHRLMPVLTGDIDAISDLAFLFAPLAIAGAVILGCVAYLVWLSPALALAACLPLGLGAGAIYAARARGVAGFWAARDGEDRLHAAYRTLIEGAREIRLSRPRRSELLQHAMAPTIESIRRVNTRAINIFVIANAAGSTLYFAVIAVVAALGPRLGTLAPEVLTGFVLVLLYMKGPVEQIMQSLPSLVRGQVSLRRVTDLQEAFATAPEPATDGEWNPAPSAFARLALSGVRYAYPCEAGGTGFAVGPLDFTLYAGELVFLIGANGSGKTTLINLLLGLYAPSEGTVRLNRRVIGAAERDAYRQHFSAVLADYFLFDTLPAGADAAGAADQIVRLGLGGKIAIDGGRLSTLDLSAGQRKRLALIHAWLENRPIVVFDEWAADQDPQFRRIFYEEVLPELQRRGKAVVAISHDDRYFHLADRLVRLEGGRVIGESGAA